MAIVSNPLIGKSKQKLGGVVFTSWKGRNVLKTKPLTVANPKTEGQLNQRAKLVDVLRVYRANNAVLNVGFNEAAKTISAYNAMMSENMKNSFVSATGGTSTKSPIHFLASKGTLSGLADLEFSSTPAAGDVGLSISWDKTKMAAETLNHKIGDIPFVEVETIGEDLLRDVSVDDGSCSIPLTVALASGDAIALHVFTYDPITGKVSDSQVLTASVA